MNSKLIIGVISEKHILNEAHKFKKSLFTTIAFHYHLHFPAWRIQINCYKCLLLINKLN
jgi:hypothetical protein